MLGCHRCGTAGVPRLPRAQLSLLQWCPGWLHSSSVSSRSVLCRQPQRYCVYTSTSISTQTATASLQLQPRVQLCPCLCAVWPRQNLDSDLCPRCVSVWAWLEQIPKNRMPKTTEMYSGLILGAWSLPQGPEGKTCLLLPVSWGSWLQTLPSALHGLRVSVFSSVS